MDVNVRFVQDILKGDNQTEIKVKFIKRLEDAVPAGEEWITQSVLNYSIMYILLDLFPFAYVDGREHIRK